jgi:hypothetical protein
MDGSKLASVVRPTERADSTRKELIGVPPVLYLTTYELWHLPGQTARYTAYLWFA